MGDNNMMLRDITRADVEKAMEVFDTSSLDDMLTTYGGGESTRWYIAEGQRRYDQKLILRMAHKLSGKGLLPSGRGTFTSRAARQHLEHLGFTVVD